MPAATMRFRSAIPGVRHSHGPPNPNPNPNPNPIPNPKARTVGMADPGNGGPVPMHVRHATDRCQTDRQTSHAHNRLMSPLWGGGIMFVNCSLYGWRSLKSVDLRSHIPYMVKYSKLAETRPLLDHMYAVARFRPKHNYRKHISMSCGYL